MPALSAWLSLCRLGIRAQKSQGRRDAKTEQAVSPLAFVRFVVKLVRVGKTNLLQA
jgi:hypothetical protein